MVSTYKQQEKIAVERIYIDFFWWQFYSSSTRRNEKLEKRRGQGIIGLSRR